MLKKCLVSVCVVILCILPVNTHARDGAFPPREQAASNVRWFHGKIVSAREADIEAEIYGQVLTTKLVGEPVRKGEPLITIDDRRFALIASERQAELDKLNAILKLNAVRIKRLSDLARKQSAARSELDDLLLMNEASKAERSLAIARLKGARLDLEKCIVRAPFDGVVLSRNISVGDYAMKDKKLLLFASTSNLEVQTFATADLLAIVQQHEVTTLLDLNNQQYQADVLRYVSALDHKTQKFELRLTPSQPVDLVLGKNLRVGFLDI